MIKNRRKKSHSNYFASSFMRWINFLGLKGLVTYSLVRQAGLHMHVQASYLWRSVQGEGARDRKNGYLCSCRHPLQLFSIRFDEGSTYMRVRSETTIMFNFKQLKGIPPEQACTLLHNTTDPRTECRPTWWRRIVRRKVVSTILDVPWCAESILGG